MYIILLILLRKFIERVTICLSLSVKIQNVFQYCNLSTLHTCALELPKKKIINIKRSQSKMTCNIISQNGKIEETRSECTRSLPINGTTIQSNPTIKSVPIHSVAHCAVSVSAGMKQNTPQCGSPQTHKLAQCYHSGSQS